MKSITLQSIFKIPLKLPLFLTIGRIFISPIFFIFYLKYAQMGISLTVVPFILLGLLLVSELTDFLDGFLARRWNHVTRLGKILDPMADSITRLTMLLTFTQGLVDLPLLLIFPFIYRDIMISTLRTVCAMKGMTLAARISGKIKAVVQAIAIIMIILLMIPYSFGMITLQQLQSISLYIVSAAAAYTLFSGFEYLKANWNYIKSSWQKD